jgi:hypothetical protein
VRRVVRRVVRRGIGSFILGIVLYSVYVTRCWKINVGLIM